jgi:proteasome lid subunit RPN8/RPN11
MTISIAGPLLERIRRHGQDAYPRECCGLLLGRVEGGTKSIVDLKPTENRREDSPENRYLIDPRELLEAEKAAHKLGLDIVGVYHSHPDHPARPSEFDREHAFPWYSYIIIGVEAGRPGDLTSWVLREDRTAFDHEELATLDQHRA